MQEKISILMDSNERGSDRAKALALVAASDPRYSLDGFADLPVDMRLSLERDLEEVPGMSVTSFVNIELKEISDFWQSKASGHLGTQIMAMIEQGRPGFVAVFGSLQEVMEAVPDVTQDGLGRPQRRQQTAVDQDLNTVRAFAADCAACNIPVHFLSQDKEQSFKYILSYAKHILTGPSMASWLPRFPQEPQGYQILCSINGIGDKAAIGLLEAYEGIEQIVTDCKFAPEELARTKINGKALGPAKAERIRRAFCGAKA